MAESASRLEQDHTLVATLDQLARIVEAAGVGRVDPDQRVRAESLALALARTGNGDLANTVAPALTFVALLLGDMAVDLAADVTAARRLVRELEQNAGLPPTAVGHELLRGSLVWRLPADVALQVQLSLLQIFTNARSVSVWTAPPGQGLRCAGEVGDGGVGPARAAELAEKLLGAGSGPHPAPDQEAIGLTVERGQLPPAALVVHRPASSEGDIEILLDAAVAPVGAILDRIELLNAGTLDGPSVVTALERRLARLRYDLHDGPQQDVHLLAMDLRLFRDQLAPIVQDEPDGGRLVGRLDDLEAQLVALDSELRHISTSMQSPFLPAGSLPDALEAITDTFTSRSGVQPEVRLTGDLTALTDSQQITLLALVREALNNVQKHSDAERVTITIAAHDRGVDAQVTDDGRGFDPETTLVQAAREGHLGVVGIHERVRMLGGQARIESRPGGPTVISVSLPSWKGGRMPADSPSRR
jgi:two-component sensor histidine kinase